MRNAILITAAVWLSAQSAFAQQFPLLGTVNDAPTVRNLLTRFSDIAQKDAAAKDVLGKVNNGFAVVFVPGILGSSLKENGAIIWPALSPDQEKLRLDRTLISETTSTKSDPGVAPQLYGQALDQFGAKLTKYGIQFVPCGYDWRRDIRAGAQDLQNCMQRDVPLNKRVIIVAHSMGGVVTWVWNRMRLEKHWANAHEVAGLVILGSPLGGSCEMLRMVQTGYVQPTDYTGYSEADSIVKRIGNAIGRKLGELENAVMGYFSKDLRSTALSWPGALELAPSSPDGSASNCVSSGAFVGPAEAAPVILSHFNPRFWREEPGKSFLSGIDPTAIPATLDAVLAKAGDFRNDYFKTVSGAEIPAFLYFSGFWVTPDKAALAADGRFSTRPWYATEGDGRVPSQATHATFPGQSATTFVSTIGVKSVHGDLPIDEYFQDEFFGHRLPKLLNAYAALDAMQAMLASTPMLKEYVSAKGEIVLGSEIAHSLGSTKAPDEQITYVRNAITQAERFRAAYCKETKCANYKTAVNKRDKAPALAVAKAFASSLAELPADSPHAVLAQGNKGMQLAKSGNWETAAVALAEAERSFDILPDNYDRRPSVIPTFKATVKANLGRALAQVGRCEDAKKYLKVAKRDNRFASISWESPCTELSSGEVVRFVPGRSRSIRVR